MYIARHFCKILVLTLLALSAAVFLFESAEFVRAASSNSSAVVGAWAIVKMALLKNYNTLQKILPLSMLIASIIAYNTLGQHHEILGMRVLGIGPFGLLLPGITVVLLFYVLHITVLNPINSHLLQKYQDIEAVTLKGQKSLISLGKSGLWIKQKNDKTGELIIVNALRFSATQKKMFDVQIFYFDENYKFMQRAETSGMTLQDGIWASNVCKIVNRYNKVLDDQYINLSINTTAQQILDSFAVPEMSSIWQIPNLIASAHSIGINTLKYKIYYYKLVVLPLFLLPMAIWGYIFGIRTIKGEKTKWRMATGLGIGVAAYFFYDIIVSITINNGSLPIILALLTPLLFYTILSLYMLLKSEF
ncbi:putative Predicted permease [Alphaproteobacteria bacterium]